MNIKPEDLVCKADYLFEFNNASKLDLFENYMQDWM
jgi:hypothetical protein